MNMIYSDQPLLIDGPTIFLCGPTPRTPDVPSWRPDAIQILDALDFQGTVLVPERKNWEVGFDYADQVEWEFDGLENAHALVFWVPRDVLRLPGFTTNVEFGRYAGSGKIVFARPDGCPHNRYLDWLYTKITGRCACEDLKATLQMGIIFALRRFDRTS